MSKYYNDIQCQSTTMTSTDYINVNDRAARYLVIQIESVLKLRTYRENVKVIQ